MSRLFNILLFFMATKAGLVLLSRLGRSTRLPRPLRWGALAGLLFLSLRRR